MIESLVVIAHERYKIALTTAGIMLIAGCGAITPMVHGSIDGNTSTELSSTNKDGLSLSQMVENVLGTNSAESNAQTRPDPAKKSIDVEPLTDENQSGGFYVVPLFMPEVGHVVPLSTYLPAEAAVPKNAIPLEDYKSLTSSGDLARLVSPSTLAERPSGSLSDALPSLLNVESTDVAFTPAEDIPYANNSNMLSNDASGFEVVSHPNNDSSTADLPAGVINKAYADTGLRVLSSRVIRRGHERQGTETNVASQRLVDQSSQSMSSTASPFDKIKSSYGNFVAPGVSFKKSPQSVYDSGNIICALTFDDGPHPELDPIIFNILKSKGVKATFFYTGNMVENSPHIVQRAIAEGHEVGQHSYNHPEMTGLSESDINRQFDLTTQALSSAGVSAKLFRPPYGAYNSSVLSEARRRGMQTINWTNDSLDWKLRNPSKIIDRVIKHSAPGDVILLHSIQRATAVALPRLIDRLREKGCQFTTVSTWLKDVT